MKTDGTPIRQKYFLRHVADASAPNAVCEQCSIRRAEREFRDDAGRKYRHCACCRSRFPELRKPVARLEAQAK